MALSLFDCNCMLGMRADRREPEPWSVERLSADMRSCGIAEALVTHAMSRDYDPVIGNRELTRLLAGTPGLSGCWAILPPATGEAAEPGAFLREMFTHGVSTVVAYPRAHNFSLSEWSLGPLLSALENARVPLLLPFGQFTWEEVERLCSSHVYLPVIVTGLNYRQLRFLLPLWEKYSNLFVELSWFSVHDGLSYLSQRGLLKQIVFGSNYPLYEPGAAVTMITYADLSAEEKARVGGETLREIIRGIRKERL